MSVRIKSAAKTATPPQTPGDAWPWFRGDAQEPRACTLPPPPPWRSFGGGMQPLEPDFALPDRHDRYWRRALSYCTPATIIDAVNAALALRRPLLVSGRPGSGKTSLIYRVAYELALGPVLVWPVNSRATLRDGQYQYKAITRLEDHRRKVEKDIGSYITLGPLGTALVPRARPRALLIDELDKADPDLPNDLLNVLEEGGFAIAELTHEKSRRKSTADASAQSGSSAAADSVMVRTTIVANTTQAQPEQAAISAGYLQCHEFPFTVITSNGEREFSPAFQRRCIRVELGEPDVALLQAIVREQLGETLAADSAPHVADFASRGENKAATDQLLNALHLVHGINGAVTDEAMRKRMKDLFDLLTRPLG